MSEERPSGPVERLVGRQHEEVNAAKRPMAGTWRLIAPDGRVYEASSPLACCGAEQRDRLPAKVILERMFAAAESDDVVLSKHIAERAVLALEQGIDLPRVAQWVAADIRRAMTPNG